MRNSTADEEVNQMQGVVVARPLAHSPRGGLGSAGISAHMGREFGIEAAARSWLSFHTSDSPERVVPEGRNTHAHTEQPQPSNCGLSIRTRLRGMASSTHVRQRRAVGLSPYGFRSGGGWDMRAYR